MVFPKYIQNLETKLSNGHAWSVTEHNILGSQEAVDTWKSSKFVAFRVVPIDSYVIIAIKVNYVVLTILVKCQLPKIIHISPRK